MSNLTPSSQETKFLGSFASIIGLLGIFLYFNGWIYRWAYFGFFQLEINQIDLPLRSFLFVPIQVFLGSIGAFLRTVLSVIIAVLGIKITLWFMQPLTPIENHNESHQRNNWRSLIKKYIQKLHNCQISQVLRLLISDFPQALLKDLIIIIWLLTSLFWLARYQGTIDAHRDAINNTSTLPVISFVFPQKNLALGRKPYNIFLNDDLKQYRIIGDLGLFEYLKGKETNDINNQEKRVWRLLIENKNWLYLFPALPSNIESDRRPLILAIRQDKEGQLIILSPQDTLDLK